MTTRSGVALAILVQQGCTIGMLVAMKKFGRVTGPNLYQCCSLLLPLTPAVPASEDEALGPCRSSQPRSDVNLVDTGRLPSNLTRTWRKTI